MVLYEGEKLFTDLSTGTVLSLLKKPEKYEAMCYLPPINPKGSEVFLFSPKDNNKDAKGMSV